MALLFFAAALAFTLVIALPRSAMQAQRTREETLIYRGEQYKRAVQLYFRKYKKYPQKLDDLEESDGIRFLRRRYKDPLTGEDEWRLVHMGSDGRFKDSVLYDLEEEEESGRGGNARTSRRTAATAGNTSFAASNAFRGADLARAERESAAPDLPGQGASAADYLAAGLAGTAPEGAAGAAGEDAPQGGVPYPNYATTLPNQIPSPTGAGTPVTTPGAANPYGVPGAAGQPLLPANQQSSNRRGVNPRAQPGFGQPGVVAGMPQQAGAPVNVPGVGPAAMGRSAADLIRNLLTTPRPGGLAGLRSGQNGQAQARPSFSEGIAGVASKVEQRGIKVYNERELYNEWEFVYDYRKDAEMAGVLGGAGQPGNINASQPGLGTGGTLQIDPSQVAPLPGVPGYPGAVAGQPTAGQPAGAPPPPGVSPFDPATGAYPQPAQTPTTPATTRPERNSRRRRTPPPLPGQPVYPYGGATVPAPGEPTPGVPGQPPAAGDPNQPAAPQEGTPQQP